MPRTRFKELRENFILENGMKELTQTKLANELAKLAKKENEASNWRQAILRLEKEDKPVFCPSDPDLLKAYCVFFNVSPGYILGLTNIKSPNLTDAQICTITGLTDSALSKLKEFDENQRYILNQLLTTTVFEDKSFVEKITEELYLYYYSADHGQLYYHILNTPVTLENNNLPRITLHRNLIEYLNIFIRSISTDNNPIAKDGERQYYESLKNALIKNNPSEATKIKKAFKDIFQRVRNKEMILDLNIELQTNYGISIKKEE